MIATFGIQHYTLCISKQAGQWLKYAARDLQSIQILFESILSMFRAVSFQNFRQTGVGIRKMIAGKNIVRPRIRISNSHLGKSAAPQRS